MRLRDMSRASWCLRKITQHILLVSPPYAHHPLSCILEEACISLNSSPTTCYWHPIALLRWLSLYLLVCIWDPLLLIEWLKLSRGRYLSILSHGGKRFSHRTAIWFFLLLLDCLIVYLRFLKLYLRLKVSLRRVLLLRLLWIRTILRWDRVRLHNGRSCIMQYTTCHRCVIARRFGGPG